MNQTERDEILLRYIARKCKELRAKRGVSQEVVYEDTHIHIGKIETAKKNISVSTLSKICKYYDVSLTEFLKDYEENWSIGKSCIHTQCSRHIQAQYLFPSILEANENIDATKCF